MKRTLPLYSVLLTAIAVPSVIQADDNAISRSNSLPARIKQGSPVKAPENWMFRVDESDIIRDTPAGVSSLYSKSCDYYTMSLFGIGQGSSKGMPCTVVENDNNEFYIYNPFSGIDTKSWLKGDIDGDRMTIHLPQAIYADGTDDEQFVYVAQLCHYETTDPEAGEGLYYTETGETEVIFHREGNSWVMEETTVNDHPLIIGLVAADDGSWCAYSDWDITLTPFEGETVTPPAGLETRQWAMIVPVEGEYVAGKPVNVGFDGDDVYVQGFSNMFPDAWVKGSVSDNNSKIIFPSRQYLGANEMSNTFGYFYGATEEEVYNEEWDFYYNETHFADNLSMNYDPETQSMTTEGTLLINRGDWEVSMDESFTAPRILPQGEITDFRPINPIAGYFSEPGYYMGSEYFSFPIINKEGQLLDTSKLYYRVYVDKEPFTFYTDEYVGLPDDTEEIPFLFSNMETLGYYGTCGITHFFYFSFTGYESIDIQTLYRDGEEVYYSDIVPVIGGSGVESINAVEAAGVADVQWYDMTGMRVERPGNGLWLKRTVMTDGTVRTEKVVRR